MNIMKRLVFTTLLLALGSAQAARDRDPTDPFYDWKGENEKGVFDYDDSQDKPWQESDAKLPPLPTDADLLPLQLDTLPPNLKAYIGAGSLSFDPNDRVLRYWLVITSPAGAYNASFEGTRCETGEYKVYAFGNPRRTPSTRAASKPTWKPFDSNWRADYRAEMMRTLLCSEATRARKLDDILATLRGQRAYRDPAADNNDF